MEKEELRVLRRQQWIWTNVMFLIYLAIVIVMLYSGVTGFTFYLVLAALFLISPISLLLGKVPHPIYFLPKLKRLLVYEKQKLEEGWTNFQLSTVILHLLVAVFFFIQAWLRQGKTPLMEGIPHWYVWLVALALVVIGNWNQWIDNKRLDERSTEELKVYAYEKRLFTTVFACMALLFTFLAIVVVKLLYANL